MLMRCRWLELINTQVKPGEGMRCDWKRWRTDRPVTLPPPPGRRVPRRNSNTGEGGWFALEAGDWQRLWESFQGGSGDSGEASRADPGTREAMADPGTREAMAEQETREAMAEQETRALFFQVAKLCQGAPWPWLWARPPRQRIYSPPPPNFLGEVPLWWALWRSGRLRALWRSGH